jgi:hypothetical protein
MSYTLEYALLVLGLFSVACCYMRYFDYNKVMENNWKPHKFPT